MRNINIGDNQIPQPEQYTPEPLPPVNNEPEKPKSNKQALLYFLAIPFIVGALLLGNYLLNKSNTFFMNKRDKMVQEQIDEHTKKKEDKEEKPKEEEANFYLEIPMRTFRGTRFILEYPLDEKPTNVKHYEPTSEIKENMIYYYDSNNYGLLNNQKGFYMESVLYSIDESTNTTNDDSAWKIIEKEDNYLYIQTNENIYITVLLVEKEESGMTNIKYYHGILIKRLNNLKDLDNNEYLSDVSDSKTLEEAKNLKKDFEKEYKIYYCTEKEGDFSSCKDKDNNTINKDKSVDINDL